MRTATNHASRWLFPGRGAGQPLRAETLASAIHELGVPAAAGRGAAIRQLVLQAPAPVVAQAFGYHDKAASRLVRWQEPTAATETRAEANGWPFLV